MTAFTGRPYVRSSDRNRFSFRTFAAASTSGAAAWKYSDDSLWMNTASGRISRIARIASVFARHRLPRAVTNPRSLVPRSFHHPSCPENVAATKISLTGV